MKLTYFGTAAAEGLPAFFCSCRVCEESRKSGGKNIRTRSQTLINDDLLIDFSADTYHHVISGGLDLRKVKSLLITHGHDDHIYPYDISYRKSPINAVFPEGENKKPLDIFISPKSSKELVKVLRQSHVFKKDKNAVRIKKIRPFTRFTTAGYTVHSLKANHARYLGPLFYIIQKDGKSILYAHDTGMFPESTWDYISKSGIRFDFVSIDCTSAKRKSLRGGHMNLEGCVITRQTLLENGNADESTVFCLNHFSHNCGYTYDELVPVAEEKGFIVSYDGMEIEI